MADTTLVTSPVLSVCATTGGRVKDLSIKDGQLIFVQDKHRVALDFNGKRRFYNQIEEIETESERAALLAPVSGMYYFVIESAVLWTYQSGWVQITSNPEKILFIGTEIPALGTVNKLYVDKANKEISVWDEENGYITVANATDKISESDIDSLFA